MARNAIRGAHLRRVAYRMLGSVSEADDAVQETWLRLSRSNAEAVDNLGGWLTTVVGRVCLDILRTRRSRREESMQGLAGSIPMQGKEAADPAEQAILADSIGQALLTVLETLAPAERLAFVLHDMFDIPFDEIAPIVGRSPAAARQLASRARRRVRGASDSDPGDLPRRLEVVEAFLAASHAGDFEGLLALLDPEARLRADATLVSQGVAADVRGAAAVASTFAGRARTARPAMIDGSPGLVWSPGGRPRVVFGFTISGGKVTAIEMYADAERLRRIEIAYLDR